MASCNFVTGTEVTFTQLPNGVSHTFTVVAKNEVASSAPATSNAVTPTMVVCTGTPRFGGAPLFSAGGSVRSLVAADFDADGKMDLAASLSSNKVAFLKGRGGERFDPPTLYDAPAGALFLVAIDFNRDGKLDLASHEKLWPGNGDGTFQTNYPYALPSLPGGTGLAFGDFNGDGLPDVVTVNHNYGPNIAIALGNGSGVFSKIFETTAHATLNVYPISVVAADFNADGKLDVATANDTFYDSNVTVLFGNGDGTLGAKAYVQINGYQSSDLYSKQLLAEDFDRDGDVDLIVASPQQGGQSPAVDGRVSVLVNPGTGVFSRSGGISSGPGTTAVAFADFDGDGNKEIVSAATTEGALSVFSGTTVRAKLPAGAPTSVIAADLDGDGALDLVAGGTDGIAIFRGRGDGTFDAPSQIPTGRYPEGVIAGELDGDGYPDFLVLDRETTTVSVMRGNPSDPGSFSRSTINFFKAAPGNAYLHNDYVTGGAFGDFNGDGAGDVALYTHSDVSYWNFVMFYWGIVGQPGQLGAPKTLTQQYSSKSASLVPGDFNGSGTPDFLATQSGTITFVQSGTSAGSYTYGYPELSLGTSTTPAIAADLNGDGRADVVTAQPLQNAISVYLMGGAGSTPDGTLGSRTTFSTGASPSQVVAADFNGDGKMDVAARTGAAVSVHFGDGAGALGAANTFPAAAGVTEIRGGRPRPGWRRRSGPGERHQRHHPRAPQRRHRQPWSAADLPGGQGRHRPRARGRGPRRAPGPRDHRLRGGGLDARAAPEWVHGAVR